MWWGTGKPDPFPVGWQHYAIGKKSKTTSELRYFMRFCNYNSG